MEREAVMLAERECLRFLGRVEQYKAAPRSQAWTPNREAAAVKRASIDLTHALADMRTGRKDR